MVIWAHIDDGADANLLTSHTHTLNMNCLSGTPRQELDYNYRNVNIGDSPIRENKIAKIQTYLYAFRLVLVHRMCLMSSGIVRPMVSSIENLQVIAAD